MPTSSKHCVDYKKNHSTQVPFSSIHADLPKMSLIPQDFYLLSYGWVKLAKTKLGMVIHAFNSNTHEPEAVNLSQFKASLIYIEISRTAT